jgi:hypothetical protein
MIRSSIVAMTISPNVAGVSLPAGNGASGYDLPELRFVRRPV